MNEEVIKRVAKCMSPLRFNVRGVELNVEDSFDPDLNPEFNYKMFIRFSVNAHTIVESVDGDDRLLRWYGKTGIILSPDDGEDNGEQDYKIKIEVEFVQTYKVRPECEIPENAELHEFGVHNVQYHAWPYIRELMQSYGEKIGIGPIPLPHYIMPKVKDES